MRAQITTIAALTALLCGCAIGDGHGFATVDGTVSFELREEAFVTASGDDALLTEMTIGLVSLQMDGDTTTDSGIERRQATLPIPGDWDPLDATTARAFGPYEIDRGDYANLSAVLGRIVLSGSVGGETFRLEIAPEGGVGITSEAALPANRSRPPLITLTVAVAIPTDLMAGTDPIGDPDGTIKTIETRMSSGVLNASWVRKTD